MANTSEPLHKGTRFPEALPHHLMESSQVTSGEMHFAASWLEAILASASRGEPATQIDGWLGTGLPFSFRSGGEDTAAVLGRMVCTARGPEQDAGGDRRWELRWDDPAAGLRLTWQVRRFTDFPAVEWLAWFENTGTADLAPLEDMQTLTLRLAHGQPGQPAYLHGAYGGGCRAKDMWPFVRTLGDPGSEPVILGSPTSDGMSGYPSSDYLPFFNLEMPEGRGVLVGLGSGGEWQATCTGRGQEVEARVGFRPRSFVLKPGQRLRGHRILLVFWQGKLLHGHNMLRRLLLEHYVPRMDGELRQPLVTANVAFAYNGLGMFLEQATEEKVMPLFEPFAAMGIEQVTIDAGWYPTGSGSWADGIGTWDLAAEKYPRGLRPVADKANALGMKLGVWFAPEMVVGDKPVRHEHPDWVEPWYVWGDGLRMELPAAREWFLSKVDKLVNEGGMQLYRQDGGSRRNIVEHTMGLLAMWDSILERYPGLLMEGCCGGGRSIDLETFSRFLWHQKSDRWGYTEEDQGSLYGANLYLPGGSMQIFTYRPDAYTMWSSFAGQLSVCYPDPLAADFPIEEAARHVALYKRLRYLLSGDFYPLTPCTFDAWIGYQFHRPDLDAGVALVFRRKNPAAFVPETPDFTAFLRGVVPTVDYEVTVMRSDGPDEAPRRLSGRELAEQGLSLQITTQPGARLILYTSA